MSDPKRGTGSRAETPGLLAFLTDECDPERWLPIEGWPGYEISDWGHVRSFWGAGGNGRGNRGLVVEPKLLKGTVVLGYRQFQISRNGSTEYRTVFAHTLVLEAFVGPKPAGMESCHFDGDRQNNRLSNLRWGTKRDNQIDNLIAGRGKHLRVTAEDVPKIWQRIVAGEPSTTIAESMDLPVSCVRQIRRGRTWNYLTKTLPGWPLILDTDSDEKQAIHADESVRLNRNEDWRPIEGYEAYRVSNSGRVQSRWLRIARYVNGLRNQRVIGSEWKDLSQARCKDGHLFVSLSHTNKSIKGKRVSVHSLVLSAFACPRPTGYVCCHNDGDPSNNHISNLRWDTVRSNQQDILLHKQAEI